MRPPADPAASPAARGLLAFLAGIAGRRTIAGQHDFLADPLRWQAEIARLTGRSPLLWGCDIGWECSGPDAAAYQHCGPANLVPPPSPCREHGTPLAVLRERLVATAIAQHRAGRIVTLMWHHLWPSFGERGPGSQLWRMQRRPDRSEWSELCTPGTRLHAAWRRQVEGAVVPVLRRLRDAGVPVLWRPYHEANGVWFWWCGQAGPGGLARLWRNLFALLVHEHGLHNLLWVWNANAPRDLPGDEAMAYAACWPGAEVVDVLAADVYHDDWRVSHHDVLLELAEGRPIAIGECAQLPTQEILAAQPRWAWFMPWGNLVASSNRDQAIRRLYADPRLLCHGDAERLADGSWRLLGGCPGGGTPALPGPASA